MTSKNVNEALNKARRDANFQLELTESEISSLEDSLVLRKTRKAALEEQIADFTAFLGDASES